MKKTYKQPVTELIVADADVSLMAGSPYRGQTTAGDPEKGMDQDIHKDDGTQDPFGGQGQGEGGNTTRAKGHSWDMWDQW